MSFTKLILSMDNTSIKENIRKKRKSRRFTQEYMAGQLDISLTAYRDLEKGSTSLLSSHLVKMAEVLDTSTEELALGYHPVQADRHLEEMRNEYIGKIATMEKRIADLERLVMSLEDTIKTKNEIITMLKNLLGEEK